MSLLEITKKRNLTRPYPINLASLALKTDRDHLSMFLIKSNISIGTVKSKLEQWKPLNVVTG